MVLRMTALLGDEQTATIVSATKFAMTRAARTATEGWSVLASLVMVFWIATGLSHPAVFWIAGANGLDVWTALLVVSQTLLMFVILSDAWGPRRAGVAFLSVLAAGWIFEWLGITTSWPFGSYEYTELLQPQLGGVPLLVASAWFMMLPPCWAVAAIICRRWDGWPFRIVAAVALTAWDLLVDPQAVQWGWWRWLEPGLYFGIPLTNYAGWFVAGMVLTLLVRPRPLPITPLVTVYAIVWLMYSIGLCWIHDLPGPALTGFVGMGALLGLATWNRLRRESDDCGRLSREVLLNV